MKRNLCGTTEFQHMTDALEKTLAIIGAELFPKLFEIKRDIVSSGLFILQKKRIKLRKDQAKYMSTYILKERNPNPDFIEWTTTGPIEVLIIGGTNAVSRWRELIGQADFSDKCIRGSPNFEAATREIRFFFPETRFEVDLGVSARRYLSETVYPKLLEGLVMLSREKPPIPVLWLAEWLLENRPLEQ